MRNAATLALTLSIALTACSNDSAKTAQAGQDRRATRIAKAEERLSATPVPRTYTIQGNQLVVLDVPTRTTSGFVDSQRCFVWRDQEFKTATISCPQPPEIGLEH